MEPPSTIHNVAKWENDCRKIHARAEDLLAGRLGVVETARIFSRLATWTHLRSDPDLKTFIGIDSETDALPVGNVRKDLSVKARVLGVEVKNHTKAYPLNWLSRNPGVHHDTVGNHSIQIEVDPQGEVVAVRDDRGKPIPATYSYWFAWQAFHPDTDVFNRN